MAWTADVTLDADKDDVGTATAVWNEGKPDEFHHSRRARVTQAEGKAFAEEAIAARDAREAKTAREANLSGVLTTLLNDTEANA